MSVMARLNLKAVFLLVCVGILCTTLSFWARCNDPISDPRDYWQPLHVDTPQGRKHGYSDVNRGSAVHYQEIECNINNEYSVQCRRENDEVYVPFSFLHKYFEVYGKLSDFEGGERFDWSHSYSKVYYPKSEYDSAGVFMTFDNYNVEVRDRVKCVSGIEGVPVSTQWDESGYFYPIQIAQYGLSHYSKKLTEPESERLIIEDGDAHRGRWLPGSTSNHVDLVLDPSTRKNVVQYINKDDVGVTLELPRNDLLSLSLDAKLFSNSSVTVVMEVKGFEKSFYIHYVLGSNVLIDGEKNHIFYGIGQFHDWFHLTRNLAVDLQKGYLFLYAKKKFSRAKVRVTKILFKGHGTVTNLTVSSSEHMAHFYDAANWLVNHQRENGGWEIPVKRRLSGMEELEPGWYSAMGQGQAISVLTRAYRHSHQYRYLAAALKAIRPYSISSKKHGVGVRAVFLDKYAWYEEYPTIPSSFVLNGFIYSLIGLYDLVQTVPSLQGQEAARLYEDGMESLKALLPLFDMGSGSAYDLRHFSLGTAPRLARWDYHTTHINQLLLLATIDSDRIISETAERWIGYMTGKRAAHN